MPTPSTGRNGSTAWSDNDAQVQETREFDLLRREFQAEVQKLSARLSLVEEGLRANGNVVAEVERAVEPEIEPVKVDVEESFAGRDSLHHLHPESDVNFEESAWTYPLVIGLADAKPIEVCFAVILLLLNLCMQLIFSGIILGPDFLGEEFDTKKDVAQRWRTSFAHDYKYVDLSSTSLVTRVCSADGSLILATTQATLVTHINSYMGLLTDQFDAGFYQPGILLCLLCILLWTLCVYKEVRSIWLALEAVWQLPRSEHTVVHENAILSLSKKRFMALLFTYITRFVIAWVLLIAGVQWLARTTSITELMLNAVALNAILDVDEFLYAGFTPVSLQVAIKHLEPVKVRYTAWRSQLESVVLFLLLLSTFILPYVSLLQPLGETMLAVKRELCYGNQTFVVGKNTQTQVILGYTTASERSGDLSVMERAVKDHKFSSAGDDARYIHFVPPGDFEKERTVTMEQESMDFTLCMETEMFHPSGSYYQDPVLTALVIPRLRTAAALGGIFDAESYEPLRGLCEGKDARQLRLICGDTCGCTDPLAFNWFRVPAYGCNDACLQIGLQKLNGQCQDVPNDENWHQLWDAYIPAVNAFIGGQLAESEALLEQVMQALSAIKQMGCSALAHPQLGMEIGSTRTWCEGNPTFFKSFAWKCPVSCGCTGPNPPSYCPSCSTSA